MFAAFDQSEFHWPMAEAAKQGKIQRMATSWKTSKMGSRQFISKAGWVPDNSYQRQEVFLIIYIKELNCLHKSPQKN